jgi:hypothetical protein
VSAPLDPATLGAVASQVLEDSAFIFSEALPADRAHQGELLEATLAFDGKRRGQIRLVSSRAFGSELAASMLGIEPGDSEASADGTAALGELLNIVGGVLVAEWFGATVPCQLGIPKVSPVGVAPKELPACAMSLLAAERFRVDVEVRLES